MKLRQWPWAVVLVLGIVVVLGHGHEAVWFLHHAAASGNGGITNTGLPDLTTFI